ncbi:MAG: nucleotidyltransferase family protein [Candidatus Ornithomonoglobus sp.]
METIYTYTIKLLRYVLNGDVPELPKEIDFEKLFAFGRSHGVENMLYVGLRDLKIAVPEDTMKKFKTAYEMAIMVEATQALELEEISDAFEKAGIDHVLLKGSVVKYLYPLPDYRKSGDIDILFHPEDEKKLVEPIMENHGYIRENKADYHKLHSVYDKPPFIKLELHRRLVHKDDRAGKMCGRVWDCVELKDGCDHTYNMNNEFNYFYTLAHLRKHLYNSGAGIRMVTDLMIILKKLDLDEKRLKEYLKDGNLTDLDKLMRMLIDKWFGDSCIDDERIDMLGNIILTSGSFGNAASKQIIIDNDVKAHRIKRFFNLLFPRYGFMCRRYSFLEGRHYLLPIAYVRRWIDTLLYKRREMSAIVEKNVGGNSSKQKCMEDIIAAICNQVQ